MLAAGMPLVALGGEAAPDAELMALSTVPAGVATEALAYLREGGPDNLRELARFLSDTVLLTGEGFAPPAPAPPASRRPRCRRSSVGWTATTAPPVGVVFYRAHELSGNTAFVDTLCDGARGRAAPTRCRSSAARCAAADAELAELLSRGRRAGHHRARGRRHRGRGRGAGGDDDAWDAGALAALDVPVLQGLCLTTLARARGRHRTPRCRPIDAAMQVAIPEFDGRLITVPFSFKEDGPDGIAASTSPTPSAPPGCAGIAVRHARLRPHPERRQARRDRAVLLPDQARPGRQRRRARHARRRPCALLAALRGAGYDLGEASPRTATR